MGKTNGFLDAVQHVDVRLMECGLFVLFCSDVQSEDVVGSSCDGPLRNARFIWYMILAQMTSSSRKKGDVDSVIRAG